MQLARAQAGNHRQPGRVKLARRGRRTTPTDPVGLLRQADTHTLRQRDLPHRHQVGRLHPTTSTMAKHQPSPRPLGSMQVDARPPRRRLHLKHSHLGMITAARGNGRYWGCANDPQLTTLVIPT